MERNRVAKLFRNGRSQAVRLPREFRFEGDRVRVRRVPEGVLLEPMITDPEEWFAAARMTFTPSPAIDDSAVSELLARRRQSQPIGEWSCGSVFTNPPGDHAARLIESAGLKGFRIGDASVSEKHANFIINHGSARAADIEALIRHVQRTVAEVHHVELATEVRIVGEPA